MLAGGSTPTGIYFVHVLAGKLPWFIAIVVVLAGLLLALVPFDRDPLQAAAMNLLSVAASLGVVVGIFQHRWLGNVIDVRAGPIEGFMQ